MVVKNVITSDITKQGVKKLLETVDDIVIKKKTIDQPTKLLKKKSDVTIGDRKIKTGPTGETVEIKAKDISKVKAPKAKPESIEEFFKSFGDTTISKKVLADFNIDKITKNEDIIKMINAIAKSISPREVVKQTRGVRSRRATTSRGTRLAQDKNFLINVLGTKAGTAYNAEQIFATRQLLEAGLARLNYLASKVADPLAATGDDAIRFRQHYAMMSQVQKVLMGVRTEAGRALNQFRFKSTAGKKYSALETNIDELNRKELLVELGGFDDIRSVAKLYLSAPSNSIGRLNAVEKTGMNSFSRKLSNSFSELFLNAILSNPLTHLRNGLGNWIISAITQQERRIAARMFGGSGEGANYIAPYEDIAKAWGRTKAAEETLAMMTNVYKFGGSKIDTRLGQITSQNWNIKSKEGAAVFDMMGKFINIPSSFLRVSDDFFKKREFRSEVLARSFAEGMEMYQKGFIKNQDDLALYIASRAKNPTKEILDQAAAQAKVVTFQTPLGTRGDVFDIFKAGQTFKTAVANKTPFSWLTNYYMPFIQTPVNIAGTVAERTPFLHKYLSNYNQMIARGGKDAALAKARMRLGSQFFLVGAMAGYYGTTDDPFNIGLELRGSDIRGSSSRITGGKNLLQKTTKTTPLELAFNVGDGKKQRIAFRGFDPVAQMFANAANFGQYMALLQGSIYNYANADKDSASETQLFNDFLAYSAGLTYSIGENLANSTMLTGAGKLVDDLRQIGSGLYQGGFDLQSPQTVKAFKQVGGEIATSYVPTVVREVGKLFNDDQQKLATELQEYALRNIKETDLEYDYDMRGRRYDKFNYFTQIQRDDIDEELYKIFPNVTPVRNYINYTYSPDLGLSVSVPLKSNEKRFLRKNSGLIFDQKYKVLREQDYFKNESRRNILEGLIQQEWSASKEEAKKMLLDPRTTFQDDQGNQVNFFNDIKIRAENLRNKQMINAQRGMLE